MRKPARTTTVALLVAAAVCSGNPPRLHSAGVLSYSSLNPRAEHVTADMVEAIPGNAYELKYLAPGVYATVRRVSAGSADGNTLFIINASDVIVVDAGHYRTDARQIIAEIRKLTDKPVRYVINTHSHGDHVMGDEIYLETFPGVEFICHPDARDQIIHNSTLEQTRELFRQEIANVQKRLDTGKSSDGVPLTVARRQHLELAKSNFEFWINDMKDWHQIVPALTVADSLVLHRGERTIEIKHLGNGHTTGDLIVYLPKERIVATGDLVIHPLPYGFSQSPREWPATLRALKRLDATTIVPGHGEIQTDWQYVDRQIALLESTWHQVKQAVDAGADLEGAHKAVNGDALSQAFGATSPEARDEFDYTYLDPAIEAAFKVLRADSAPKQ
jgi:cyclase